MAGNPPKDAPHAGSQWFATTHWSVVLAAGESASPQAGQALEKLCHAYWYPLYAYVRRQGHGPEDAQDLTQEFFARLLQKQFFRQARPERGRFRSFLLTSLKHFLVNEWHRATARKRGSGHTPVPLDTVLAERLYCREPGLELPADKLYERNWALALLEQVRARLRKEYAAEGRSDRFEIVEQFLPGEESGLSYVEAARQLGLAEGTLKSDVHRFRQRYRQALRAEIAHTVTTREDVDEELRHLLAVLGG
jgi:RNA polymerase sigma-70 factor (ECF subfamily)